MIRFICVTSQDDLSKEFEDFRHDLKFLEVKVHAQGLFIGDAFDQRVEEFEKDWLESWCLIYKFADMFFSYKAGGCKEDQRNFFFKGEESLVWQI
jgi:hypothetical protein